MVTINLFFIITVLAGGLSLYDGIARLRGRRSGATIVAVAEIVFAALLLLSLFIAFPAPLGLLTWALLLEVALIVALVLRGKVRRGSWVITIIALVLTTIVVLVSLGWLHIPGLF
ncbi:hypothetical protein PYV02_07590 [Leifsonia sp. H3M29-4]|uniref:hypothetical protein n=1 Tax=Salinibacterium metalliresistens TaxID=3031321 RepID=UPI0023DB9F46|nr:hypothetical protein [Salinibacterium metalliresistens]MDF1478948.1 hypothetical protein [Salinibacterium metalliresistens]